MFKIEESEYKGHFPTDAYFERTGKIRTCITECTREELMDLARHYMQFMESKQGILEQINNEFEEILGYKDPLR